MKLNELMGIMVGAGFRLPKKKHNLQEAKVSVNPKTGGMMFADEQGRLWSLDRRENHFDVLKRNGEYFRINCNGEVIGSNASSFAYAH